MTGPGTAHTVLPIALAQAAVFAAPLRNPASTTTVGALKTAITVAQAMTNQKLVLEQITALKEGRIDIGFGRLRHSDPGVTGTTLREERLVVALPFDDPLAAEPDPMPLADLAGRAMIVYPREPRPSYADFILAMLREAEVVYGPMPLSAD
mgnify:CR=1 FL=1